LLEEAWQKGALLGDRQNLGNILNARAVGEAEQGATVEAMRLCGESLHCYAELRNRGRVAAMLHALADLLTDADGIPRAGGRAEAQRLRHATVLLGASDTLLRLSGYSLPWRLPQPGRPLSVTEVRERLGADAYAAAFAEGQAMSLEAAVAYAESVVQAVLAETPAEGSAAKPLTGRQSDRERYGGLTIREREVAAHIAQGRSNREIAAVLVLSERTVDTHLTNILNKLGYDSRTQIAAWAVRVGLNS
jgi:DNA-binding CsgD family transcriptional regulator